ncbi:MAG TPA: phage holin family protein [Candidatus Nanoarchaeia archaeon]|nr:hypothetical protein [uncultured archaeon]
MQLLISWLVNSIALFVTAKLVPGIRVDDLTTLFLASLVIGVINTLIKPVLQIISLPITILTLGIFALIINAALLNLAAWLVPGFEVNGFLPAFLGAIVLSVVSTILHSLVKPTTTFP